MQPYATANILGQTIAFNADVVFPNPAISPPNTITLSGIGYNNLDTFTALQAGVYYIAVTLNLATGSPVNAQISLTVNDGPLLAPIANSGTSGQITLIHVLFLNVGDNVNVKAGQPLTIVDGSTLFSAGNFVMFRISNA